MRRTLVLGSVLLPAALLATGCASNVPHADGPAGPVTAGPSVSSAPVSSAPAPSTPASTPPSPSHPATSHAPTAPKVLGPTGYGALKLGMTSKKATATGLIVAWRGTAAAGCSLYSHLVGGNDDRGFVMFSGDTGVEVIDAVPGVSTPAGIHVGSTKAQLLKAYPDWANSQDSDPHADGVGATNVPGNTKAYYRIETAKGKVIQLTLQVANENCYE